MVFSLDHPNYSRLLSVHIHDMYVLDTKHPSIAEEFREGKFTVNKTQNKFSSIAIDHAHEQNNKCVKGDGGVIGQKTAHNFYAGWFLVQKLLD